MDFELLEEHNNYLTNKELKQFIFTKLLLNNIELKNKKIFFKYIEELSLYQIYICSNNYNFLLFEVFKMFYTKNSYEKSSTDIFIYDNSLTIYKNQDFFYFQKISTDISKYELKNYLEDKLKIRVSNIYEYTSEEVNNLKTLFLEKKVKTQFEDLRKTKINSFIIFICFSLLMIISIFFYFNYKKLSIKKEKDNQLSILRKENQVKLEKLKYEYLYDDVDRFINYIKRKEFNLLRLNINNNILKLSFDTKNKKSIYEFLEFFKKSINSNSIIYDRKNKNFMCDINVEIYRK